MEDGSILQPEEEINKIISGFDFCELCGQHTRNSRKVEPEKIKGLIFK